MQEFTVHIKKAHRGCTPDGKHYGFLEPGVYRVSEDILADLPTDVRGEAQGGSEVVSTPAPETAVPDPGLYLNRQLTTTKPSKGKKE